MATKLKACELCKVENIDRETINKTCADCADYIMEELVHEFWDGVDLSRLATRTDDYISNDPYAKSKLWRTK